MAERLEDKVGVVVSGASGIGRATAMAFARAGAKVVLKDSLQPLRVAGQSSRHLTSA